MALRWLLLFLLALCTTARSVPGYHTSLNTSGLLRTSPKAFINHTENLSADVFWTTASDKDSEPTPEELWCKYISRGTSLMKAMMMSGNDARTELGWPYVQSLWDGDMRNDMQTWGYLDSDELHQNHDGDCDFAVKHGLGSVFRDSDKLNTDPRSSGQGGPNHCFYIQHSDSPVMLRTQDKELPEVADQRYTVNGVEYRATDAHAGIGVNPQDGFLYFLDRTSAQEAAKELWERAPASNELPRLRSTSDIAFAFWSRVSSAGTRKNLKHIMSCQILNDDTEDVIERALAAVGAGNIQGWPGTDFEFAFGEDKGDEIEAALALLGSPNGNAAGYFLIQHKVQMDWKYIWKVKIFESGGFPYLLFYVSDHAPWEGPVANIGAQLEKSQSKARRKRGLAVALKKSKKYKSVKGRHKPRL